MIRACKNGINLHSQVLFGNHTVISLKIDLGRIKNRTDVMLEGDMIEITTQFLHLTPNGVGLTISDIPSYIGAQRYSDRTPGIMHE